jgi:hypothetical protein
MSQTEGREEAERAAHERDVLVSLLLSAPIPPMFGDREAWFEGYELWRETVRTVCVFGEGA